ncbi:MAG: hypothetical protein H6Q38_966 [Chloroflexi bacterium]|nr:hypothetical protein [Chloroflexota bacterium]
MTHSRSVLTGRRLNTPRAAAVAGILFTILFSTSVVLIRLSLPPAKTIAVHGSNLEPA